MGKLYTGIDRIHEDGSNNSELVDRFSILCWSCAVEFFEFLVEGGFGIKTGLVKNFKDGYFWIRGPHEVFGLLTTVRIDKVEEIFPGPLIYYLGEDFGRNLQSLGQGLQGKNWIQVVFLFFQNGQQG
jgi:hypothetical protein